MPYEDYPENPNATAHARAMAAKQNIANLLTQRGLQPIQGQQAGRFYVKPSWAQGVAQLAQAGLGGYMTGAVGREEQDRADQDARARAEALAEYRRATESVPEVPASNLTPETGAPPQAPPSEPPAYAQMASLLAPQGDQGNLPQGIPNDIQQQGTAYMNRHPATGQIMDPSAIATPPIPEGQGVQYPQLPPQEQMAQTMSQPPPQPPQMQGPIHPGAPARERTPQEQQAAMAALLTHNDPIVRQYGTLMAQQQAAAGEKAANRAFLEQEKAQDREVRREGIEANVLTRVEMIRGNMLNTQAQIDARQQSGRDANDLKLELARQNADLQKTLHAMDIAGREKVQSMKPGAGGKALPGSIGGKFMENSQNLRMAERAKALIEGKTVEGAKGDPNATGMKGYLPDMLTQRFDPGGVETRAAVANLGSMIIHDRSGAAVTASEYPRLKPFIPAATDDPATVKKKLGQFVTEYQKINDEMTDFYSEAGYQVPKSDWHQTPESAAPPAKGMTPTVPGFHDPAKQQEYEKSDARKFTPYEQWSPEKKKRFEEWSQQHTP